MESSPLVHRSVRTILKIAAIFSFIAPLLTRLIIGYAFYETGSGKWGNLDRPTGFFTDLGIPFPHANAILVATMELVGGICLIFGLCTRFMAAGLSVVMSVALLTAHKEEVAKALSPLDAGDLTGITPVVYLMLLLWLVFFGPGFLSLDRLFHRWLGISKPAEPAVPPTPTAV